MDVRMNYFEETRGPEFEPPNNAASTGARPGSLEKIRVMAERLNSGQPLHHEDDETFISKLSRQKRRAAC